MKKVLPLLMTVACCMAIAGCASPATPSAQPVNGTSGSSAQVQSDEGSSASRAERGSGNASSGAASPQESSTEGAIISEDEAMGSALARAGVDANQVERSTVTFEYDDGIPIYQVKFYVGQMEYDAEVSATDGTILEFEAESIYD